MEPIETETLATESGGGKAWIAAHKKQISIVVGVLAAILLIVAIVFAATSGSRKARAEYRDVWDSYSQTLTAMDEALEAAKEIDLENCAVDSSNDYRCGEMINLVKDAKEFDRLKKADVRSLNSEELEAEKAKLLASSGEGSRIAASLNELTGKLKNSIELNTRTYYGQDVKPAVESANNALKRAEEGIKAAEGNADAAALVETVKTDRDALRKLVDQVDEKMPQSKAQVLVAQIHEANGVLQRSNEALSLALGNYGRAGAEIQAPSAAGKSSAGGTASGSSRAGATGKTSTGRAPAPHKPAPAPAPAPKKPTRVVVDHGWDDGETCFSGVLGQDPVEVPCP